MSEGYYLNWIKQKLKIPSGIYVGHCKGTTNCAIELTIKEYEGKEVERKSITLHLKNMGCDLGSLLHAYVIEFFKSIKINKYHLHVSPIKKHAIAFYNKNRIKKTLLFCNKELVWTTHK